MKHVLFGLFLLTFLPACSLLSHDRAHEGAVTLVNDTDEPVYVAAWELEASYLIDPILSFPSDAAPFPRLTPGASVPLGAIEGYESGDDVRLFLYAPRPADADSVHLVRMMTVTDEALRRARGRIVLNAL